MIVTTTNVLAGVSPTITTGASSDTPSNITSEDFSLNYTSTNQQWLGIEFGVVAAITYVAVAGITNGTGGAGRVKLLDGVTSIETTSITRNNVIVFTFESQSFTNLKIELANDLANLTPTVSYIAAGNTLTIPNSGETGGHNRSWLERSLKTKTTVNSSSAPISSLRKKVALKGKLNIPNVTASFSQVEWQDFLDFASENIFFINEDSTKTQSSYCCYELMTATVKAHGQTRALNNLALSFKIYNGL